MLFPQRFFLNFFNLNKDRASKLELEYLHGKKVLWAKLLIYIYLIFQTFKLSKSFRY